MILQVTFHQSGRYWYKTLFSGYCCIAYSPCTFRFNTAGSATYAAGQVGSLCTGDYLVLEGEKQQQQQRLPLRGVTVFLRSTSTIDKLQSWTCNCMSCDETPSNAIVGSFVTGYRLDTHLFLLWECWCALWQNFTPGDFLTFWVIF